MNLRQLFFECKMLNSKCEMQNAKPLWNFEFLTKSFYSSFEF